jgi:hypothetical protein
MCIDAFKDGLGGFLIQNYHAICYESRNIKENEINYSTHDLEFEAIVHALNMWRHYLICRKFEMRTNHICMKYLFEYPTLNSRQDRWLKFLSEYVYNIKHIKGKY